TFTSALLPALYLNYLNFVASPELPTLILRYIIGNGRILGNRYFCCRLFANPLFYPSSTGNPAFNQNPYDLDKDLVTRSTLVCGGGKLSKDEYNLGLHVMALFVVMFQSTLGTFVP